MRRVAMLALTIGLTLIGVAGSAAARPAAAAHGGAARAARWLGPVPARTIRYAGYLITVPASWPVYRLSSGSSQCVRYDQHAVYLGQPGGDQLCPAHLVGRTDTISVQAGPSQGPPGPPAVWRQAPAGLALNSSMRRAGGQVLQDAPDHQVMATASRARLTISATYGSSPALVTQVIRSIRRAPGRQQPAPAPRPRPAPGRQAAPGRPAAPGQPVAPGQPAAAGPARSRALTRAVRSFRLAGSGGPRRGFDTCSTPSLATMRRWRRAFSAMAVYIGGPEAACGWGSLSAGWVRGATAMGWALIPTYVGRQAPCERYSLRITPGRAYAQGRAAARQAIGLAAALGMGRHAPIYDDMEFYRQAPNCRLPVLSFLNGWTRQLHALGHPAGVYSSANAAVVDLGRVTSVYGHRVAKPNSVWFGLWDGRRNLYGLPYLLPGQWPAGHRIKQWQGAHWHRVGGVALNIDSDLVAGAVYRLGRWCLAVPLWQVVPGPGKAGWRLSLAREPAARARDPRPPTASRMESFNGTWQRPHRHTGQPLQAPRHRLPVE